MKVLFTGGGSGGHIIPIIAIVRELRRIYPDKKLQVFFVGPKDQISSMELSQEDIKVKHILAGKIRRYSGIKTFFQNLIDVCFKVPIGMIQSFFHIFFAFPDVIFSKGGFGSIPVVLAAKFLWVPIFLHESDSSPGLANRFLNKFSLELFVSFPKTEYFSKKKMIVVGNPIRKEVLEGSTERAKEIFKLTLEKPVLLVLGGSQGAQRINDKILEILPDLLNEFEVIHQCGEKNFKQVKKEAAVMTNKRLEDYYHPVPFLKEHELRHAYAAANFIISRGGSGAIFEIAAAGKPSIIVPLPESAQNHQLKNAYNYCENGACDVLEESNFTPHFFLEKLKHLFANPGELKEMSEKAKEFSRPQAAKIIAHYLAEYLKK